MTNHTVIRPADGNAAYKLARLAAGAFWPVTGVLAIDGFKAQIIEENETEAIVPELPCVGFIQVLDRRPTVHVVLDGPGREHDLQRESFIVLPPGLDSRWQSRRCAGRVLHAFFDLDAFARWSHGSFDAAALRPVVNLQDGVLADLVRVLRHALLQQTDTTVLYLESLAVTLATNILRVAGPKGRPRPAAGGLAPRQLRRTTEYMLSRVADSLSLSELAAIAGLSPHHFCRAFRQSTGQPPHAWLTARRIERAQEMMLTHKAMGLTEVALSVGYSTQAAFGVAFRRVTGKTPGQWRRERVG